MSDRNPHRYSNRVDHIKRALPVDCRRPDVDAVYFDQLAKHSAAATGLPLDTAVRRVQQVAVSARTPGGDQEGGL
jgi:hypothetical protein